MLDLSRRGLLGAALLGGTGLMLGGCGRAPAPPASPKPRYGGRLRLGIVDGDRSGNLDAHKPIGLGSTIRGFALYDKLWEWSSEMTPLLSLAEEAEVSRDARFWTIRLKQGLEFHHGKTIDADDVIFSIRRLTDPELASPFGSLVRPVDRDQIAKLDNRTVRLVIRDGDGFVALPQTWVNFGGIVPQDYHPVTNPVGAGPYKIVSPGDYVPGQRALFRRFENYHKPGRPYAEELEIIEFKDQTARFAALLAGQIDVANSILPEHAATLANASSVKLVRSPTNSWHSFDMNINAEPFRDVRVRQAFRLLVDRQDMVERVLHGEGRIANDLYSPQDPCFAHHIPQRQHDPEEARSLLKAAGYEKLKLEVVSSPFATTSALAFAEQAKRVGIAMSVRKVDMPTFTGPDRTKWAFSTGGPMGSGMPGLDYLGTALSVDAPTAANNKTHFNNPEFARRFDAALAEPDVNARRPLLHAAQQIQHEQGGFHRTLHPDLSDQRVEWLKEQSRLLWLHGFLEHDVDIDAWIDRRPLEAALALRAAKAA
ncbi:MAG: ABC transporter substrate-binding protein [Novosphingobium sp.]